MRRLGYRGLGSVAGFALPCITAAAEDASPAVQRQGLWALHHLATGAYLLISAKSIRGIKWIYSLPNQVLCL